MSTVITKKLSRSQVILIMLSMLVGGMFMSVLLIDRHDYRAQVEQEVRSSQDSLSRSDFDWVYTQTLQRFNKYLMESGAIYWLEKAILPAQDDKAIQPTLDQMGVGEFPVRMYENLQVLFYQCMHRLTLMQYWLFALLPFVAALLHHGVNNWRIKQYSIGGTNRFGVRISLKALWFVFTGILLYALSPISFGAFAVYFPAFTILVLAWALYTLINTFDQGF